MHCILPGRKNDFEKKTARRTQRESVANRGRWGQFRVAFHAIAIFSTACSLGCAGLGEPVQQTSGVADAPDIAEILASLADNDARIETFRAGGSSIIDSSQLEAVQRFRSGRVLYRRPADLFVEGKLIVGAVALRMISTGDQYLIEFPVLREYFGHIDGVDVQPVPFDVPPIEIAREMFFPVDWAGVRARRCEIVRFDRERGQTTFRFRESRKVTREVTVEGPPWVVVKNDRVENGKVVASTVNSGHNVKDGIRFPTRVVATFPEYDTTMEFRMRNIRLNEPIDEHYFTIDDERLAEIGLKRLEPTRNFGSAGR